MKKTIGVWMYTNECGYVIRQQLVDRLIANNFDVVYDFDMRECFCLNGEVFTKNHINLSKLDALYFMNAEERNSHQDDILKALAKTGVKIINDYEAYWNANDKFIANTMLRAKGISVPEALLIPSNTNKELLQSIFIKWQKIVIKPRSSLGAEGIIKFDDFEQFYDFYKATENFYNSFYIEKFVNFIDRDIRVEVFNGKVIGEGFSRVKTHSYKTNAKAGGIVTCFPASQVAQQLAVDAVNALGTTASVVDMVYDIDKQALCVIEVNPFLGLFFGAYFDSENNQHTQSQDVYEYFKNLDELKIDAITKHIIAIIGD